MFDGRPPPPTFTAGGAAVPITMFIPPTVFIRADRRELTTNTGCAPRSSDRFLVEVGGGPEAVGAPESLIDEVMAGSFTGDWRETGRWHEI